MFLVNKVAIRKIKGGLNEEGLTKDQNFIDTNDLQQNFDIETNIEIDEDPRKIEGHVTRSTSQWFLTTTSKMSGGNLTYSISRTKHF